MVPTVAEVEMLKREQEESKRAMVELQKRTDTYREEYEVLERWVWSLTVVGVVMDSDGLCGGGCGLERNWSGCVGSIVSGCGY